MKKHYIIMLGTLALALLAQEARAQLPVAVVKDKSKRLQMEREVITRWNRFEPKWYFILFHNTYRKGDDRRNMLQLVPMLAAVRINEEEAAKEHADVGVWYDQEMFKFADRSLNKSYHLIYSNKIEELNSHIGLLHLEGTALGVPADYLLKLKHEKERINADIKLVLESYEDDAIKGEQYRVYLQELQQLRGFSMRMVDLYKTNDQHQ